jgi:hypothetical protein
MKSDKLFRAAAVILLLLPTVLLPAANPGKKVRLALLGGLNLFSASGSDSDYVAGENDFPRSPAYQAPAMGFSAALFTSPLWAWGIDVRYGFSSSVDLSDPSDHETIRVDSPKYLTAVAGGQRFFTLSRSLALYAAVGAGIEYRQVEEKEFVSDLGSKIFVGAPAKPVSPLLAAGIGLQYALGDGFAVGMECRVAYALRDPAQMIVTPALVLALRF